MAQIVRDVTLAHRANLGDDVAQVELHAGEEVQVLKVWQNHVLVKDAAGRLFNIPKNLLEDD